MLQLALFVVLVTKDQILPPCPADNTSCSICRERRVSELPRTPDIHIGHTGMEQRRGRARGDYWRDTDKCILTHVVCANRKDLEIFEVFM